MVGETAASEGEEKTEDWKGEHNAGKGQGCHVLKGQILAQNSKD